MEVAGQWRREWAGTAEYGKVTEGGVTRRVARAMEVLHASAPGARVRVMRAAYHSSAGPGAPASSYLMHSSRKVLSSGYNFLEPSSLPAQPLEISSTPLEASPESEIGENEEYKVTEPDDYDISEPSKWRGSARKNSIRMPSEESSSTDNASIIDLDSRASSRSTLRRRSNEKEDLHRIHHISTRVSPLLDAPVALSTLKYTSILNGSDDWNSRRKSYSFEDTSPVDYISPSNTLFTKDSSTDSGICKSSEIVNDNLSNIMNTRNSSNVARMDYIQEENFKDWLSKNRSNSYKRSTSSKTREIPLTEPKVIEDKITLQSSGKVTITLPIDVYKDKYTDVKTLDDSDKKTKKVEFCKTELHFAVDTGTVNIIETDEKPPPSNDFRKRRSAFVPLNDKIDRSITLFGEKNDVLDNFQNKEHCVTNSDSRDSDENIAATKSILKNKIPKPKPYLLGENMVFGSCDDSLNECSLNSSSRDTSTTNAVSLINKQLQAEREPINKCVSSYDYVSSPLEVIKPARTGNKGPQLFSDFNHTNLTNEPVFNKPSNDLKKPLNISSSGTSKIRELRGSDLAYFGVDENIKSKSIHSQDNLQEEEIFQSVKLVQQISNSVCNSEAESDDTSEYQNISFNSKSKVVPIPKPRSKYIDDIEKVREPRKLKPIIEQDTQKISHVNRSKISNRTEESRKQQHTVESPKCSTSKSVPANFKNNYTSDLLLRGKSKNTSLSKTSNKENETAKLTVPKITERDRNKAEVPAYVNINHIRVEESTSIVDNSRHQHTGQKKMLKENKQNINENYIKNQKHHQHIGSDKEKSLPEKKQETRPKYEINVKKEAPRRTEKLTTPDYIHESTKRRSSNNKSPTNKNYIKSKITLGESQDSLRRNERIKKDIVNEAPKQRKERIMHETSKNTIRITKENDKLKDDIFDKSNSSKVTKEPSYPQNSIIINKNNTDKVSNIKAVKQTGSNNKSKRSKYVINYDDKNGTVSSICKIKAGPGTYKRKLITVDKDKDAQDSNNNNNKSLNKIALRK